MVQLVLSTGASRRPTLISAPTDADDRYLPHVHPFHCYSSDVQLNENEDTRGLLTSPLSIPTDTAAVGINPLYGIQRLASGGSNLGNLANTIIAGLSECLLLLFVLRSVTRLARPVGRSVALLPACRVPLDGACSLLSTLDRSARALSSVFVKLRCIARLLLPRRITFTSQVLSAIFCPLSCHTLAAVIALVHQH